MAVELTKKKRIIQAELSSLLDCDQLTRLRRLIKVIEKFEARMSEDSLKYAIENIYNLSTQAEGSGKFISYDDLNKLMNSEIELLKTLVDSGSAPHVIIKFLSDKLHEILDGNGRVNFGPQFLYKEKVQNNFKKLIPLISTMQIDELKPRKNPVELRIKDIDSILKSQIYDVESKAFIYQVCAHRLKKPFLEYIENDFETSNKLATAYILCMEHLEIYNKYPQISSSAPKSEYPDFPPYDERTLKTLIHILNGEAAKIDKEACKAMFNRVRRIFDKWYNSSTRKKKKLESNSP